MKHFLTLILVFLLATVAYAKEATFTACTTDHIQASLTADIADGAPQLVSEHIAKAFKDAASHLTFSDLQDTTGYMAFLSGLTEDDTDAIRGLNQPVAVGHCS